MSGKTALAWMRWPFAAVALLVGAKLGVDGVASGSLWMLVGAGLWLWIGGAAAWQGV